MQWSVATWPSSDQEDVKDTSERALKEERVSVHCTPRIGRPTNLHTGPDPGPWVWAALVPLPTSSSSHAGASELAAHTNGLQGPEASWTGVSGNYSFLQYLDPSMGMWLNSLGGLHSYGRICFFVFADIFLHSPFITDTPSSGSRLALFETPAHKTRNQGKDKLRGMLKITDRGFHDSALLLYLLVFHVKWAKLFSYLKRELKTTYAQLYINFVLFIFYFSVGFWFIKLLDFLLIIFLWNAEQKTTQVCKLSCRSTK